MSTKKDVVYYFDEMIGTYHYAFAHPMKPLRVAMTDEIVRKYQLDQHFDSIVEVLLFRIYNLGNCTTSIPMRNILLLSIRISILISSELSLLKIDTTLKTNFIASISKKIVQSWNDSMTTVLVILLVRLVYHPVFSHCFSPSLRKIYIWNQLVRRTSSCQTVRSFRVLLH